MNAPIAFKDDRVHEEFNNAPMFLKIIVEDFARESFERFGITAVITRVLEEVPGASQIHGDYRAVDLRDDRGDGTSLYDDAQAKHMVDYMNTKYWRNDGKITCLHHSFNDGPMHFHIQVSVYVKTYMKLKGAIA